MDWLKICKDYYDQGFYDNTSLKKFVVKGKITEKEYKKITGTDYLV